MLYKFTYLLTYLHSEKNNWEHVTIVKLTHYRKLWLLLDWAEAVENVEKTWDTLSTVSPIPSSEAKSPCPVVCTCGYHRNIPHRWLQVSATTDEDDQWWKHQGWAWNTQDFHWMTTLPSLATSWGIAETIHSQLQQVWQGAEHIGLPLNDNSTKSASVLRHCWNMQYYVLQLCLHVLLFCFIQILVVRFKYIKLKKINYSKCCRVLRNCNNNAIQTLVTQRNDNPCEVWHGHYKLLKQYARQFQQVCQSLQMLLKQQSAAQGC